MKPDPQFSIIVPTHDRPALLREAIQSILGQTFGDFEVIVVDDGGARPASVPDDDRVRLIRLEENGGPAVARNAGLEQARGRYITFLDDDDQFTQDRLEMALEGLDEAPIALCGTRFVDEPSNGTRDLQGWVHDSMLNASTPTLGSAAVERDLVVPFDERWQAVEDLVWWLEMSKVAPVSTVPRYGYLVGRHRGLRNRNSLSERIDESFRVMEVFGDYFGSHRRATAFRYKRIGLMARATGDQHVARRAFLNSLRYAPEVATAWHLIRTSAGR